LNTKEFILSFAEKLHISRKEAANLLHDTTTVIRETVSEEKKLTLLHLGSFEVKKSASRTAYIPALNKKALIPPRRAVRFQVAETLKDKLKNIHRP
jgi:nucleoid DNA-binding protein